jgi:hypothetical protein
LKGAIAIRQGRVDVHAGSACGLAVKPVSIMLETVLAVKFQGRPRATVTAKERIKCHRSVFVKDNTIDADARTQQQQQQQQQQQKEEALCACGLTRCRK